ncbi:MAG: lysophospholipid acyltransferase family protein [Myxococcota bacterium]|nr:lysophospholipid acyltransferase family protein [Myxococcota bacterium]
MNALEVMQDTKQDEFVELEAALESLRDEIRCRFPASSRRYGTRAGTPEATVETPGRGAVLVALAAELRERLATLGMREQSAVVDEFGMDEAALHRAGPVLDGLFDTWWRVAVHGLDRLPPTGGCLLAANRSGVVPYDGLMLSHAIARFEPSRTRPAFLVDDRVAGLPFVQPRLARLGGVRACTENTLRLLRAGRRVIAFPEGVRGATKLFRDRYRLQRFSRGGVVRLALETGLPLLPVGIVGAEEAHPVLFKAHRPARAVGLSYLPVTLTFPLLGPFGLVPLPTKWGIRIGEPLALDDLPPDAAQDDRLVSRLTEELRVRVQERVDRALGDRQSVWE